MDQMVARLRRVTPVEGRYMLGIAGAPGAGKTTLAAALALQLGSAAAVVEMDAFHLAKEQLRRLERLERQGAPDTFDVAGYLDVLRRLRVERTDAFIPVFDPLIEEPIAAAELIPTSTRLIITEGAYLLFATHGWHEVRPLLDEVWYLEIAEDERRNRIVARRRDHGRSDLETDRWFKNVDEPYRSAVQTSAQLADLVLRAPRAGSVSIDSGSVSE